MLRHVPKRDDLDFRAGASDAVQKVHIHTTQPEIERPSQAGSTLEHVAG